MGIDWFRVRPKSSASVHELRALIDRQALSFQAITGFWMTDPTSYSQEAFESEKAEYGPAYVESSEALAQLFVGPPYDEVLGHCTDYPDLESCRRTCFITRNSLFPPQWQMRAYRSYLPDELPTHLARWSQWAAEIREGKHRGYLFELWRYETSLFLRHHWETLQGNATASLEKSTAWARKSKFLAARDSVLNLDCPELRTVPAFEPTEHSYPTPVPATALGEIDQQVRDLVSATRRWDSTVKGERKVRYYESYYPSFEAYLDEVNDDSLLDGIAWVERCCELGFGLFLDY